ncbi:MAG: outer membrane protein assembly factor BamD [Alphaproteobacteria bacterium]|nr:outer membrane protein assembly factor BamD [Alphaproteobacteria bacterium]
MDKMDKHLLKIAGIATLVLLVGCIDNEKPYVEKPAAELYSKGYEHILKNDYKDAAENFDEVERQHPYSEWATRGQLMSSYANYLNGDYDKAIGTLDSFIQLHPGYKHIDYAYYLKSLCYYDRILAVTRDQKNTYEALSALATVVKKFPNTKYGRDAQLKMDLVYDHLAGKEMTVGRYYMRQGFYLPAINRFQTVIDAYQRTTHVPEALHRLVECYLVVGLKKEAQTVAAVLGHNYPGSEWYADTYFILKGEDLRPQWIKVEDGSWVERLMNLRLY